MLPLITPRASQNGNVCPGRSSVGTVDRGEGPPKRPVPPDCGGREPGGFSERAKLVSAEAPPHRERSIVLHHRGEARDPAQGPDANVGKQVTVKIVDENSPVGDPAHLDKHTNGLGPMEVVEKQGGVYDVHPAVFEGQGLGVPNLYLNPAAKPRGKGPVKVRPGVADGDGVGINAEEVERTPQLLTPAQEVHQVIATPAPYVDQTKMIMTT